MKTLITTKLGMTGILNDTGDYVAVTVLQASTNYLSQLKTNENDGYNALQLATRRSNKQINKAQEGHFKALEEKPTVSREFRVDELPDLKVGDTINVDVFTVGDNVQVSAISKGKGFAGTIKRHNFHRQRKTHGGKGNTRKVGSIGSMYPQKIFKGKKMSGRMGNDTVTVKNLEVIMIDAENGLLGVKGAVPGPKKGLVLIEGLN
jgi:large subunit ribosomal protein L3